MRLREKNAEPSGSGACNRTRFGCSAATGILALPERLDHPSCRAGTLKITIHLDIALTAHSILPPQLTLGDGHSMQCDGTQIFSASCQRPDLSSEAYTTQLAEGGALTYDTCASLAAARCAMVGGTVKAGFCDQGGQFCSILRDLNNTYTGMCRTDADCEVSDGVLATKKLCCDLVHPAKSMEAMCDKVDKVKVNLVVSGTTIHLWLSLNAPCADDAFHLSATFMQGYTHLGKRHLYTPLQADASRINGECSAAGDCWRPAPPPAVWKKYQEPCVSTAQGTMCTMATGSNARRLQTQRGSAVMLALFVLTVSTRVWSRACLNQMS